MNRILFNIVAGLLIIGLPLAVSANQPPEFAKGSDEVVPEDFGPRTVPNWAFNITPGSTNEIAQQVTFLLVTNSNPALFISGGQPAISSTGTLTYTTAPHANGVATLAVRLQDDGGTASGGVDASAAQTFKITVMPVNDSPTFTLLTNVVTVLEDTPFRQDNFAFNILPGPGDESTQKVSFVAQSADPRFFKVPPALSVNGTLTFTPASHVTGESIVTIVALDTGGTALGGLDRSPVQMLIVRVTPVNDPPSFALGSNQTVNEDAPAKTVPNFASNITPGPTNEFWQEVTFIVTNSNAGLFSGNGQPAISPAGTLTYAPASAANGAATVTVRLQDNGGTAHGGTNLSAGKTFTITVKAVNDLPSFNLATNLVVWPEDTAASLTNFAINLSPGPANEVKQTVSFVVAAANPSLFATPPAISPAGVLTFKPATNAVGSTSVSVAIKDSGDSALGGTNRSPAQTFTITISPVNDAPVLKAIPAVTIKEDTATNVTFMVTDIDTPIGDVLTSAHTSNTNLVTEAGLSITGSGTNRTLAIAPSADANGAATISVIAEDQAGGRATNKLQLTVLAVNDPPGFILATNLIVFTNAVAVTNFNFATNLSKGPTNEASQTLTFIVTNNNKTFFAVPPAISANGTLTFKPATNATGSAVVSVVLQDNGGTANGGTNRSAPQSFSIVKPSGPATLPWAEFQWIRQAGGNDDGGGSQVGGGDKGNAIAVDAAGNSYVTGNFQMIHGNNGTFSGGADFGGTHLSGNADILSFLAKYDNTGTLLWAKTIQVSDWFLGPRGSNPPTIAVDSTGNSYITGVNWVTFSGRIFYIAKYDTQGNKLWVQEQFVEWAQGGNIKVSSIATDSEGNSYVTGAFSKAVTFGDTTLTDTGNETGDIFIAKFSNTGASLWAKKAGGPDSDQGKGIAVDLSGNIYVTGGFKGGSVAFENTTLTTHQLGSDMFIAKYSANGALAWVKQASSAGSDGSGVAVDAAGNSYVTGIFLPNFASAIIVFDANTHLASGGGFVVKYDSAGNVLWAAPAGADGNRIAADTNGNGYVTGSFGNSGINATFGNTTYMSPGGSFVAKYDTTGKFLSAARVGDSSAAVEGIDVDSAGNVYLTGHLIGNSVFGSTALNSVGLSDIFVAKLLPTQPSPNMPAEVLNASPLNAATLSALNQSVPEQIRERRSVPVLQALRSDGMFQVSVPTSSGQTYHLEYIDSLIESAWKPADSVAGDGTVKMLTDRSAAASQRFYRVRLVSPLP